MCANMSLHHVNKRKTREVVLLCFTSGFDALSGFSLFFFLHLLPIERRAETLLTSNMGGVYIFKGTITGTSDARNEIVRQSPWPVYWEFLQHWKGGQKRDVHIVLHKLHISVRRHKIKTQLNSSKSNTFCEIFLYLQLRSFLTYTRLEIVMTHIFKSKRKYVLPRCLCQYRSITVRRFATCTTSVSASVVALFRQSTRW